MSTQWLNVGTAVDPSWWAPLERLSSVVAARPELPPVIPDDFLYCAYVTRDGLPPLHVYRHLLSHKQLCVDEDGVIWRYVADPNVGVDHYAVVDGLAGALARAELGRGELLTARTRAGRRAPAWSPSAFAGVVEAEALELEARANAARDAAAAPVAGDGADPAQPCDSETAA